MIKQLEECIKRFRLTEFQPDWGNIRRGIEKESLRISPAGVIAGTPHPSALGSTLTNPYITTDFSEALLEFITPPSTDIDECINFLDLIHRFVIKNLNDDEYLWVFSMPCPAGDLDKIPLALYGNSNIGRMKTLYRRGLSHRYGSLMQTIAGIHYNFSMPDNFWPAFAQQCNHKGSLTEFRNTRYLHLIRNFHRHSWLLIYLFGASPVTCKCFAEGREHKLEEYDDGTLYLPYATCLRMSNLGYRSDAQNSLNICYNTLDSYVESLNKAMHTPYAPYEKISAAEAGEPLQINSNILQLENEFYSSIRPKRVTRSGERPLSALIRDGIEYVEVRALDLNPFLPVGIDAEQIRFLDAFLLFCLFEESPDCNEREYAEMGSNTETVVLNGRDPQLKLSRGGEEVKLTDWADAVLESIRFSAGLLDATHKSDSYSASVEKQQEKVNNPDLTPSGKILAGMRQENKSFYKFAMALSQQQQQLFTNGNLAQDNLAILETATLNSLARQKEIEDSDSVDFATYLQTWNEFRV